MWNLLKVLMTYMYLKAIYTNGVSRNMRTKITVQIEL